MTDYINVGKNGSINKISVEPKNVQKLIDSGLDIRDISELQDKPTKNHIWKKETGYTLKPKKDKKSVDDKHLNRIDFLGKLTNQEQIDMVNSSDTHVKWLVFTISLSDKIKIELFELLRDANIIDDVRLSEIKGI